ncbi:MAG: DNA gyrase subunit B, partial [Arenimonas sp.]|nr:DNA gyrase subunit B [Arenimonas sp.]
ERGHVYIGLPPLYKIKQGKNELYLKDDGALNAYLVNNAVEGAELRPAEGVPPVAGAQLEKLLLDYVAARETISRFAHRIDPPVLEAMLEMPPLSAAEFATPGALDDWCAELERRLNATGLGRARYGFSVQAGNDEGQPAALVIAKQHHGLASTQVLAAAQLLGGELRQVNEVATALHDLLQDGAVVARGGKSQPVTRFLQAQEWLLEEAKKGRMIQRFKGLGEMNPEQLWETTVNPETRRLLKVRIEDAVAADQIFSTLMGDVVEPRREFIEDNALRVANLDV